MLDYVVDSVMYMSSRNRLNLPTYTLNYTSKFPRIICQATGRVVVPLLPHMTPCPPLTPPPWDLPPARIIIHPLPAPIHLLVHVVLRKDFKDTKTESHVSFSPDVMIVCEGEDFNKEDFKEPVIEQPVIEQPVVEKVAIVKAGPIKMGSIVIPPSGLKLQPDHSHIECKGNCKKHPLMSPLIYKMMYGYRRWGDMLYDSVI